MTARVWIGGYGYTPPVCSGPQRALVPSGARATDGPGAVRGPPGVYIQRATSAGSA